jgi:hypothetical protein
MPNEEPLTLSVPEAGKRYYGLSRNASYAAAEVGDIPTIRVGKLLRVPVRAMERRLDSVSVPPPIKEPSGTPPMKLQRRRK